MRKFEFLGMLFLAFSCLLTTSALFAQGPPPAFPEERKEKVREEIETIKMWKMLEALDLSQEQSDRFIPAWRDFQKAQRTFRVRRENLFRELETTLEGIKPKERRIKDIFDQLEEEREKLDKAQQRFKIQSKEILNLEQQAKLLLFEERFERRMMEIIRQYREKRRLGD